MNVKSMSTEDLINTLTGNVHVDDDDLEAVGNELDSRGVDTACLWGHTRG